jgi:hypothetical protein
VVATRHIDEQCVCSPHSLSLGRVGRSEVMHIALHLKVYLYFYEVIDVCIIVQFKFHASSNCYLNNLVEVVCLLRFSINLIRLFPHLRYLSFENAWQDRSSMHTCFTLQTITYFRNMLVGCIVIFML